MNALQPIAIKMMNKLIFKTLFILTCAPFFVFAQEQIGSFTSPNGDLTMHLFQKEGITYYDLQRKGLFVLEASELGMIHSGGDFYKNLKLLSSSEARSKTETYSLIIGKKKEISKTYKEAKWTFSNESFNNIEVIFRLFDDGMAFRYHFPYLDNKKETVFNTEQTTFNLPDKGEAWLQPYDSVSKYTPATERYFENALPIAQKGSNTEGWIFPTLYHSNDQWTLISESDLGKNYCGMHLQPNAENGIYRLRFPEKNEGLSSTGQFPVTNSVEWFSPWRVIITGKTLGSVIESTLVTDVARPVAKTDFSWVKSGRASWSWWSDWDSPKDTAKLKKFVNMASDMGWEYSLIDANWHMIKKGNVDSVINYANKKKIGTWLWYNSGGKHNDVTEAPKDIMSNKTARRAEFERISKLGVKGIKVDFFQSDKQFMIELYLDILQDAADFKLMVNFHGCTIPRGWQRTYPHLVSMESVKGAENYHFEPTYPQRAPSHNTILAATRNVIGSMDYTPVTLTDVKYPRVTTIAHELALAVIFESGVLHLADKPESYKLLPEVVNYLKTIPSTWDEIKYLSGTPGKDMVLARRSGSTWYIAGINGENTVKELEINVLSLNLKAQASATMIADIKDRNDISVSKREMNVPLKIKMAAYGGFVAVVKEN
jgi:alpha-glucosidase